MNRLNNRLNNRLTNVRVPKLYDDVFCIINAFVTDIDGWEKAMSTDLGTEVYFLENYFFDKKVCVVFATCSSKIIATGYISSKKNVYDAYHMSEFLEEIPERFKKYPFKSKL